MDPSRPILLGVLAAAASCASWTPGAEFAEPSAPQSLHEYTESDSLCPGTPSVLLAAHRVVIAEGCSPRVVVFRRNVIEGLMPELLGSCDLPCVDEPGNGIFAYSIAQLDDDRVGQRSAETFVSVETSTVTH